MRRAREIFGFDSQPGVRLRERLLPHLTERRTIYIFHSPEETIFKRWGPFQALVAEKAKGMPVEKVIPDRSGKQMFVLIKVEEQRGD